MKTIKQKMILSSILFCIALAGCGAETPIGEETSIGEEQPMGEEQPVESGDVADLGTYAVEDANSDLMKPEISIDAIRQLSEKENLTVEDVSGWNGVQSMGENGFYYEFLHEGKTYRLDIVGDEGGNLKSARLVDMATYLSIDIRTGSIDNLLSNTVSMSDYLTSALPDGWTIGEYDIYLGGHFGGSQILDSQENPVGDILIMHGLNPTFSEDELINIDTYDNNVSLLTKESLMQCEIPCILTIMTEEKDGMETEYRCAYFAKEGCDICYQIKVRSDCISEEEMIALLETVTFAERAFF
ncbi:MAG: hypothetical protein ACI4EQ_03175 [Lachnospiraceae bacterium]